MGSNRGWRLLQSKHRNIPGAKKKWKIRSLPTIIVFQNGTKELSYRANIMMELDVTAEDIHEDIEDLLSDKF